MSQSLQGLTFKRQTSSNVHHFKAVFTSKKTHRVTITNVSIVMICTKIVALYNERQTKNHEYTL
jgi:hypothetical protein